MSAPAHTTGDRLDRVTVGQFVQLDPIVLGAPTPSDGWLEVVGVVNNNGAVVSLTLGDESSFNAAPDRLVRIGWNAA